MEPKISHEEAEGRCLFSVTAFFSIMCICSSPSPDSRTGSRQFFISCHKHQTVITSLGIRRCIGMVTQRDQTSEGPNQTSNGIQPCNMERISPSVKTITDRCVSPVGGDHHTFNSILARNLMRHSGTLLTCQFLLFNFIFCSNKLYKTIALGCIIN